jgi:putative phosphoesterase
MQIAILSDTHNQHDRVRRALEALRQHGVRLVLHCGDIEDPSIVELFEGFDAHFVFGNCDWDKTALAEKIQEVGLMLHEGFGHVEVDGKQLAFVHGDDRSLLGHLEQAGCYDYLFHGHTHVAEDRRNGPTRIINPGALHRARVKTFVVLDPASGVVESIVVE